MKNTQTADREMKLTVALLVVGLFGAIGLGYYFATITASPVGTISVTETATSSSNNTTPYLLTLEITTNNLFNSSVGDQPAYYVVGPNGLQSSANITLPAHRTIELVIINFDQGNATLPSPQFADVTGTTGGTISLYSNDVVNSSESSSGIQINASASVSSVSPTLISHTFTVPGLGLNIPVASQSTIVAFFATGAPGNYLWLCASPCGSGATGTEGAMETPGWMTGVITVG